MIVQDPLQGKPSLVERFEQHHRDNPIVYETLLKLARTWISRRPGTKLGIAMLYENARWEIALATSDPEFKLNNNFKAFYARLLEIQEPELRGIFEFRDSEADAWALAKIAEQEGRQS